MPLYKLTNGRLQPFSTRCVGEFCVGERVDLKRVLRLQPGDYWEDFYLQVDLMKPKGEVTFRNANRAAIGKLASANEHGRTFVLLGPQLPSTELRLFWTETLNPSQWSVRIARSAKGLNPVLLSSKPPFFKPFCWLVLLCKLSFSGYSLTAKQGKWRNTFIGGPIHMITSTKASHPNAFACKSTRRFRRL